MKGYLFFSFIELKIFPLQIILTKFKLNIKQAKGLKKYKVASIKKPHFYKKCKIKLYQGNHQISKDQKPDSNHIGKGEKDQARIHWWQVQV